jgi:hypothetical protein
MGSMDRTFSAGMIAKASKPAAEITASNSRVFKASLLSMEHKKEEQRLLS